jgi:peptide/nickel transport system permease protein
MAARGIDLGSQELARPQEESQAHLVWRRFRKHKLAVIGVAIIVFMFAFCFVGPLLTPFEANAIPSGHYGESVNLAPMSRSPLGLHLLGTDSSGRDYLTRLMIGGRVSLTLAIVVVLLSESLGAVIGGVSGYFGGWVDSAIMRAVDFLLTLPTLPLYLVLYEIIPPSKVPGGSILLLGFLLVVLGWVGSARLVRGMTLSLRNQDFTEASRALGASGRRIIARHMLPNSLAPVLVAATLSVGGVIIAESSLSFIGFGIQPPAPSWGNMLQEVQGAMFEQPYQVFFPGMCIFLTSLSFNFIGDALRDALDPRLKM